MASAAVPAAIHDLQRAAEEQRWIRARDTARDARPQPEAGEAGCTGTKAAGHRRRGADRVEQQAVAVLIDAVDVFTRVKRRVGRASGLIAGIDVVFRVELAGLEAVQRSSHRTSVRAPVREVDEIAAVGELARDCRWRQSVRRTIARRSACRARRSASRHRDTSSRVSSRWRRAGCPRADRTSRSGCSRTGSDWGSRCQPPRIRTAASGCDRRARAAIRMIALGLMSFGHACAALATPLSGALPHT